MAAIHWIGGGTRTWSDHSCLDTHTVPTSSDDVYFDGTGGGASNCTINSDCSCKSIDFTGYSNTLAISGAPNIQVYAGNITISSDMGFSGSLPSLNWKVLVGSGVTCTITSNGKLIGNLVCSQAGTVSLADAISCYSITHNSGTLTTNNYGARVLSMSSTGTSTRVLNLGSSTITIDGAGTGTSAKQWDCTTTTGLTLNAGTSTIYFSDYFPASSYPYRIFYGGGLTYYNLKIGADDYKSYIYGSNTFNNIEQEVDSTADPEVKFEAGTTTTFTTLTMSGYSASQKITLGSITSAAHDLSCPSGTISCNHINISYSEAGGGATFSAGPDATDGGNNTGWDFPTISSYSGSITASITPGSAYFESQGYMYSGSLPVSVSPSSVSHKNAEWNGSVTIGMSPAHSRVISLGARGSLGIILAQSSVINIDIRRAGSLTTSFGVSSLASRLASGYYPWTGRQALGIGVTSVVVIRQALRNVKDPVVVGGCPGCGTFLYNR